MKFDVAKLGAMSLSDLVRTYNDLTGDGVKKFSDRKSGVRRVLAALERAKAAKEAERPAEPSVPAKPVRKAEKAPTRPPLAERRQHTPSGELRPPRPGSKRGRLLAALQKEGMTAAQIAVEFQWTPRDVADALRLLAHANGYVVHMKDDGETWRAAEPERDGSKTVASSVELKERTRRS